MRSDIVPGGVVPDYELPDHSGTPRRLSDLQGNDPLVLTLARGHYCPKEHQQHLELAAFYPKVAVAYAQIATISTDDHHALQEFRASVGAQWTFLSDPERTVQKDLDIQEYTDPEDNPIDPAHPRAQTGPGDLPHLQRLLVLGPPVRRRRLARPARGDERDPPRLGFEHPRTPRGLERGRLHALPRLEQRYQIGPTWPEGVAVTANHEFGLLMDHALSRHDSGCSFYGASGGYQWRCHPWRPIPVAMPY
jgi:peroxiredoxin